MKLCVVLWLAVVVCGITRGSEDDNDEVQKKIEEILSLLNGDSPVVSPNTAKKASQGKRYKESNNGIDDEGLSALQQRGSSRVETPQGEIHNPVVMPQNPDENLFEAKIQSAQLQLREMGIEDAALLRTISRAIEQTKLPFERIVGLVPEGRRLWRRIGEKRSAFQDRAWRLWEEDIVPYIFDSDIDTGHQTNVLAAMQYLEDRTCLTFVPWSPTVRDDYNLPHSSYLKFVISQGCWSYLGRTDGEQQIAACGDYGIGIPLHELFHAVGSHHEQSRNDRDKFIQVHFNRIPDNVQNNFRRENTEDEVPYDYGSIMQYTLNSFGGGKRTMSVYNNFLDFLPGSRSVLGFYDIKDLNEQYECKADLCPNFATECQNGGFVGIVSGVCQCMCPFGLGSEDCSTVELSCGGTNVYTLNENQPEVFIESPNYPGEYDNDQECVWLVKAEGNDFIKISFDHIDLEGESFCYDSLEVRHDLIGQPGERYCGTYFNASRISTYNTTLIVFRSDATITRTGFRTRFTLVPRSTFTYNLADNGVSYRGVMYYTQSYVKCVNWTLATDCPVTPASYQDFGLGEHNYCRNPTGALRPWCYTDSSSCEMDFCDVSLLNYCYDKLADCEPLVQNNYDYCERAGFSDCHKTCGLCDEGRDHAGQATSTEASNGQYSSTEESIEATTEGSSREGSGSEEDEEEECLTSERGLDYTGTMAETEDGEACRSWSTTSYTNFPDESVEDARNYCRNPDLDTRPWCITATGWGFCNIPRCPDECRNSQKGLDYLGTTSETADGEECIPWTETDYVDFPDASIEDAMNYCRNPDNDSRPWCVTATSWGYCNIPMCRVRECLLTRQGFEYAGTANTTRRRKPCRSWVDSGYTNFPDATVEDAKNYCRNPDADRRPWCLTSRGWGYCDIPLCSEVLDCFSRPNGVDYAGTTSVTAQGLECLPWTQYGYDNFPDESVAAANNYCRNPDNDKQPWCFTSTGWGYCDIPHCQDLKRSEGTKIFTKLVKKLKKELKGK